MTDCVVRMHECAEFCTHTYTYIPIYQSTGEDQPTYTAGRAKNSIDSEACTFGLPHPSGHLAEVLHCFCVL